MTSKWNCGSGVHLNFIGKFSGSCGEMFYTRVYETNFPKFEFV
jgi:hypothetical protein